MIWGFSKVYFYIFDIIIYIFILVFVKNLACLVQNKKIKQSTLFLSQ